MNITLTPLQARVAFHQERVFRSTGDGRKAHARYVALARAARIPDQLERFTPADCAYALYLIQRCAEWARMHLFRDVRTGWERVTPGLSIIRIEGAL